MKAINLPAKDSGKGENGVKGSCDAYVKVRISRHWQVHVHVAYLFTMRVFVSKPGYGVFFFHLSKPCSKRMRQKREIVCYLDAGQVG
jgi:hypothetical protein